MGGTGPAAPLPLTAQAPGSPGAPAPLPLLAPLRGLGSASARPCPRDTMGHPAPSGGFEWPQWRGCEPPPCPHVAAGAVLGRAFPAPPQSHFANREDSCWHLAPLDPAQPHTAPSRFAELPAPPRGWVCSLPSPAAEEAFIRWGNRTGSRPLTHGLFTRRACESYSEKCVTVRHRACAQTWGRHGARRGGEGTCEVWAEPRGAAAPRPHSPWWGRGRSGDGQGGLGQGLPGRCRARRCRSAVPWVPGASPPHPCGVAVALCMVAHTSV